MMARFTLVDEVRAFTEKRDNRWRTTLSFVAPSLVLTPQQIVFMCLGLTFRSSILQRVIGGVAIAERP